MLHTFVYFIAFHCTVFFTFLISRLARISERAGSLQYLSHRARILRVEAANITLCAVLFSDLITIVRILIMMRAS